MYITTSFYLLSVLQILQKVTDKIYLKKVYKISFRYLLAKSEYTGQTIRIFYQIPETCQNHKIYKEYFFPSQKLFVINYLLNFDITKVSLRRNN